MKISTMFGGVGDSAADTTFPHKAQTSPIDSRKSVRIVVLLPSSRDILRCVERFSVAADKVPLKQWRRESRMAVTRHG